MNDRETRLHWMLLALAGVTVTVQITMLILTVALTDFALGLAQSSYKDATAEPTDALVQSAHAQISVAQEVMGLVDGLAHVGYSMGYAGMILTGIALALSALSGREVHDYRGTVAVPTRRSRGWWSGLTINQKIAVAAILVPSSLALAQLLVTIFKDAPPGP